MTEFEYRKNLILARYEELVTRRNVKLEGNGIYNRYQNPVVTAEMIPPTWKYDFNPLTNPYFHGAHRLQRHAQLGCHQVE